MTRSIALAVGFALCLLVGCAAPPSASAPTQQNVVGNKATPPPLAEATPVACPFPPPATDYDVPVPYRGVHVSQTTAEQVPALLGPPTEHYTFPPDEPYYVYNLSRDQNSGPLINIHTKNGVVTLIIESFFYNDFGISDATPRVAEFVEHYGCPDALFIYQMAETVPNLYRGTMLLYVEEGLEVQAVGFPLTLTNPVQYLAHRPPQEVESQIAEGFWPGSIAVTWEEALTWIPPASANEPEEAE